MNPLSIRLTYLNQCHSNDNILVSWLSHNTKDPLDHSKAESVQWNCQSNALGVKNTMSNSLVLFDKFTV